MDTMKMGLAEAKARRAVRLGKAQAKSMEKFKAEMHELTMDEVAQDLGITRKELDTRIGSLDQKRFGTNHPNYHAPSEMEKLADYLDSELEDKVGVEEALEDKGFFSMQDDPHCLDCGVDTDEINEDYTVTADVWLTAHPMDDGSLCIGCLEERLGRQLTTNDFVKAGINYPQEGFTSARMIDRVGKWDEIPEKNKAN